MIDFAGFIEFWSKMVVAQIPDAQSEVFNDKLSRLGVKAPHGTPPAMEQLAKAIAVAKVGSGAFMGTELGDSGVNSDMLRSELMVKQNMGYHQAGKVMKAYYASMNGSFPLQ